MLRLVRPAIACVSLAVLATSCVMDRAPAGLRRTPDGPGATVRFDLAHRPLPEIPLPNDSATWPDPTSRTGLRINASLIAPTNIERQARERFSQMEGWGTFSPISVAFDIDRTDPIYKGYEGAALDLANIETRHQGDDYEFADDAVYLVNLTTGVPVPLDLGAGNFAYTLKKLDKYWANDSRVTERNLLFDTIDETRGGLITKETFKPEDDTDFDGNLDIPNLDDPAACPGPDAICDNAGAPEYNTDDCFAKRRQRDRCIADHLVHWYERETDTLILRPVLPLDEMTRYAIIVTDRTVDAKGNAVKSPFDFVYHAAMEASAKRVMDIVNDQKFAAYFGDIAGTGLDHVAFTWSFTTQPTVDDMKRLRDGLYGQGPFARWEKKFPPKFEVSRAVGLTTGVTTGEGTDAKGWENSDMGVAANCPGQVGNLYTVKYPEIRQQMPKFLVNGFDFDPGPGAEQLLREFDNIDHMVVGTFKSPFLLEGGPKSTDPNAAFHLNFQTGDGEESEDTIQFWLIVPKETAQHKQPFNVAIYGHGYTGNFSEGLIYAGNVAGHGLATIGINAMGHGLSFDKEVQKIAAKGLLSGGCVAPFYDAISEGRARDLNNDGVPDSGGDFWSSYLFHTRDGVRQSVLDHIQLVRILRTFGQKADKNGPMICRNAKTGWDKPAKEACDVNGDGTPEVVGDFDGDGVADVGGEKATYGTWGESLGGILSGIHGAIDAYVTSAVPGSGGGGLTDIGIRSFQGGVIEAVLLRIWGPLIVAVPASERASCAASTENLEKCTLCKPEETSIRWVVPDLNGTGEVEVRCVAPDDIAGRTIFVNNLSNGELRCATVTDGARFRVGIPSSIGDEMRIDFFDGKHQVSNYKDCVPTFPSGTDPHLTIDTWGKGLFSEGTPNDVENETCGAPTCNRFQGHFFGEGTTLTAPAEGFGEIRQTPALRRFIGLAQTALDPGDPISFAPYYSIKQMTDPFGKKIAPHAVLTLNTIGDMNVPLNSGIAFARATGALPFFRADQVERYPEYANYSTPEELFRNFGNKTPNQVLIDNHVIEGITALARHPAGPECENSQNAAAPDATFLDHEGVPTACFPSCTGGAGCFYDTHCDEAAGKCVPNTLGKQKCEEALFDADDLDEGADLYFAQSAPVPLRLARFTQPADPSSVDAVWAPRLKGTPFGNDLGWVPDAHPLTALLDAYLVPEGVHTFVNGEPCQSFDAGTYLSNLTGRFFMTNGTDLYYLSHPKTHSCLGKDVLSCGYLTP